MNYKNIGLSEIKCYIRLTDYITLNHIIQVDFIENPDVSRNLINRWVEQHTGEKIKQLFPPGAINRDTKLALVSALYFKVLFYHFTRKIFL